MWLWVGKWSPVSRVHFKGDGGVLGDYGRQRLGSEFYLVVPGASRPLGMQAKLWVWKWSIRYGVYFFAVWCTFW